MSSMVIAETCLGSEFLPRNYTTVSLNHHHVTRRVCFHYKNQSNRSGSVSCSVVKTVPSPRLDKHVVKHNKTRFIQKLKTLLLSKPKHYLPLHILSRCRSYLALSTPKSIISMVRRYPTVFELFSLPWPPFPIHAAKSYPQLCVRLTPAAEAIAARELRYKASVADDLANKLQKLLMISSHRRLTLSKLVHIAPDLGLPPNFRSRLCNDYPGKFKVVDTSYGRALELVSWDSDLAKIAPSPEVKSLGLIVDRPLKFKRLRLRKGLNVKRRHKDFLIKFGEVRGSCPYTTVGSEFAKQSMEAEKRACAVIREVLAMTVEKRTLVDHLTHFRKEFGFPNKLRGMIVRHPELFYVSVKGLRDSVLLVEGYDEKGKLLEKDESVEIKEELMELVREGKRMKRERRRAWFKGIGARESDDNDNARENDGDDDNDDDDDDLDEEYVDGFEDLFGDSEEDYDGGSDEVLSYRDNAEFWTAHLGSEALPVGHEMKSSEPW